MPDTPRTGPEEITVTGHPAPGSTMLRHVVSSGSIVDVDQGTSDLIRDMVDAERRPERQTYTLNADGQTVCRFAVLRYPDPQTAEDRWAVLSEDAAGFEVEDTADHDEAAARYEYIVRDQSEDGRYPYTVTDVAGIPSEENS
jgi:hypothetical protein